MPIAGPVRLDDGLAGTEVPKRPWTVQALRIGSVRDGSKIGVLAYSQEHAREWATPLVTLEFAERLLANYATDPATRELLDSVDVFVIPTVNPDGANYSFNDFNFQRKNLVNHCTGSARDPRNARLLGRGRQPQLRRRLVLRRVRRRQRQLPVRHLRRHRRAVRGGEQQRGGPGRGPPEHQVLAERAQLRRLLHVVARRVQGGRPDHAAPAVDRRVEVLPGQRPAHRRRDRHRTRDGDLAVVHRPGGRRALLGGRQLGRPPLLRAAASWPGTSRWATTAGTRPPSSGRASASSRRSTRRTPSPRSTRAA